ncbi:MAG TPA: ABC transporter permease, partial [Pyrodictium sp.]|nr:ABC transporter permease [Pyrodictium sp.]
RTVDVLGNIPLLPVLVLLGVTLQELDVSPWTRLFVIIGFLVIFGWGGMAIIVRSMTLSIKSEPYIDAAKAIGASDRRIIFKHILPQIVPYAMANLVFSVPGAILVEAGLSVLGIRHGLPTWGSILADARDYIGAGGSYGVWWWILPPGILIGITSLAFVFLGLALETVVEPRLKRR